MSEKNAVRASATNVQRKEQYTILIIDCLITCAAMTAHFQCKHILSIYVPSKQTA